MGRVLSGGGSATAPVPRELVRDALFDPGRLARAIPGAQSVDQLDAGRFGARLDFGVGPFRSVYAVELVVSASDRPFEFTVSGYSAGGLGNGRATGQVRLLTQPRSRTTIEWTYDGDIGGPVALAGRTLLAGAARVFCARFFDQLIRDLGRDASTGRLS